MPLPANTTTVVVLGTFNTPEGNPSTGTITFTPSAWLLNSGANIAIPNSAVSKTLGTAGNFSVTLPITDDADLSPNPFIYTVTEVIDGVSQSYNISIPGTVASGGTVYLADLAPVAAAGPEYYSLASSLAIGTVTTLATGSAATATITGLAPSQTLNLGIPTGPAGSAATVTVGTIGATAYPGPGTVTNSGSSSAAVLDFTLVTGQQGATGATGPQGAAGSAASVTVGTVGAVAYPGPGTVTNSGSSSAAVLDFILVTGQQGATGPQGATGSAATITVGSVTSVPYGGTAAVTNVGNSAAGTFDFVLVTGPQGAIGDLAATAPLDYTSSTFSLRYGAGLGTASGGTLVADFSDATPQALGAAGAAGTSVELSRGDHVHARPTPADIGAVGTATAITAGTGLAGGGDLSTSRTLDVVLSSSTPAALGTAAAGTATSPARGDHVHAMPSASDVGAVANSLVTNKGSLVAATAASTPADLPVGSNGQMLMADSSATAGLRYVDPPANRNLIINGAMQVAQRGTSTTGITAGGYYTADRWNLNISSLGTWTHSVETDAPTGSGFRKSLKVLCTTADAAPAAGDFHIIQQILEGQDVQRIAKGTSSAQQLTLSFWVKANVTGTFIAELEDSDNSRAVSASYTISQSATWERKTITFPADTTGALNNDNGSSLVVLFWLGSGSTFSSGTLQTTWASITNANIAVGQTNLAAATNNYWQVTGVQLETGPVATPFEFEPYEATLRKCQRYYYRNTTGSNAFADVTGYGSAASTTSVHVPVIHPVIMRVAPTAVAYSSLKWRDAAANSTAITAATIYSATPHVTIVNATSSSLTANRPYTLCGDNSTTAHISLDAEL